MLASTTAMDCYNLFTLQLADDYTYCGNKTLTWVTLGRGNAWAQAQTYITLPHIIKRFIYVIICMKFASLRLPLHTHRLRQRCCILCFLSATRSVGSHSRTLEQVLILFSKQSNLNTFSFQNEKYNCVARSTTRSALISHVQKRNVTTEIVMILMDLM